MPGLALLIVATAIAAPVVEHHHMVWLLLPIWIVVCALSRQAGLAWLILLGLTGVLLSQPYRLVRVIDGLVPFALPEELWGRVALELGAVLLYVVVLLFMLESVAKARHEVRPATS
jgi:hypothetical protein